jgi:hypothetical protein
MYPSFDLSKETTDESQCFYDTQGRILCNNTTYFAVDEKVVCPDRMCKIETQVNCHGQDRCEATKSRLSISKNDQLYDRFVNEKHTWK